MAKRYRERRHSQGRSFFDLPEEDECQPISTLLAGHGDGLPSFRFGPKVTFLYLIFPASTLISRQDCPAVHKFSETGTNLLSVFFLSFYIRDAANF